MGPKVIMRILRPSSASIFDHAYITCPIICPSTSMTSESSGIKTWVVPVMVEDKMLHAAGTVNVPECFSGEIFDDFKVARLFRADIVFFHCLSPKFLCESAQSPWKTA